MWVGMLQYADDTLFFCKVDTQSVMTLKTIRKCFEPASSLKGNYSKSKVGGVGVSVNEIAFFETILSCRTIKAPLTYLGVTVGWNHKRQVFWEGVLDRLRSRLGSWKGKILSLAGRLCLIKYVLTSLPLFYIYIFHMLVIVIKEVERI